MIKTNELFMNLTGQPVLAYDFRDEKHKYWIFKQRADQDNAVLLTVRRDDNATEQKTFRIEDVQSEMDVIPELLKLFDKADRKAKIKSKDPVDGDEM